MYRGPSIDHSLISPSGRMSKRARAAAMKREAARLFPDDGVQRLQLPTPQPAEAERLRAHAARLEDLAARGMSPRRYRRLAAEARAEAARLDT